MPKKFTNEELIQILGNYPKGLSTKIISLLNITIYVTEVEASSLHEGNFARFKIKPSDFFEWHKKWV